MSPVVANEDETLREGRVPRVQTTAAGATPRYRPIREIARGGMGRVIEAFDTQLARTVALKEILDGHPEARARFDREVEITARLEHPSIVPLYDAGDADGAPFYVMRKVAGEPLDAWIRNAASLDQRLRLLPNVLAVADAVAHAHARGVIHRDLKPTNVLIGELGETVVIDWGLAKLIGEADAAPAEPSPGSSLHTRAGTVFGTPGFMPPEQLRGEPVDERADVYALGGCLYHVLAGARPPEGTPSFVLPGAPPELVTIVRKAMAPERTARYLDAGGFGEDLRRFLGGQLVAAHHYPVHQRLARWLRRHRAIVLVTTLALVLAIAGGIWAVRRILAEQQLAEEAYAREQLRADDLLLFKVSAFADTNPTLAAATLQELPEGSPRWATLGGLLTRLRAQGVAYGYPGPGKEVRHVEVSRLDDRILASGFGGATLIDPVARTAQQLSTDRQLVRASWWGSRIVLAYNGKPSRILDPVTRALESPPWPDRAADVALLDDGGLCYVDGSVALAIDGRGGRALVELGEPLTSIRCTASWAIATSQQRAYLLRATAGRLERVQSLDVAQATIVFDDERKVLIAGADRALEYDLASSPPAERRRWEGGLGVPQYLHGALHGWMGKEVRTFDETPPRALSVSVGHAPEAALPDGRIARLVDARTIALVGDLAVVLRAPEAVDALGAGRRVLVAASGARVFVWRLDDLALGRTPIAQVDTVAFTGPDTLVGVSMLFGRALRSFRLTPALAALPEASAPYAPELEVIPTRGRVATLDLARGRGDFVLPARLPIALDHVAALGALDDDLLAATSTGALYRVDGRTAATELLADVRTPVASVAARAGFVIAMTSEGRIWRRAPGGAIATTEAMRWLSPALAPDGTVYAGLDRQLWRWPVGGAPSPVAVLPAALARSAIAFAGERHVVVVTEEGSLHRHDRLLGVTSELLAAPRRAVVSEAGIAVALVDDTLVIAELASGTRYTLARQLAGADVDISHDGTRVVVVTPLDETRSVLHTWSLAPPDRAWLQAATNAAMPDRIDAPIRWRD